MFAFTLLGVVSLWIVQSSTTSASLVRPHLPVIKYAWPAISIPMRRDRESMGVAVTARSAYVFDVNSGTVLFSKNANIAFPVASLTKLVTVMTFLDTSSELSEQVTLGGDGDLLEGRVVFAHGERLTKKDLLRSTVVGSINASAYALGGSVGDRALFVRLMNEKARKIGMQHAIFYDPTGLDPRNIASARDIALALSAALQYPEILEASRSESINVNGMATGKTYTIKSTNLLLQSFLDQPPYEVIAAKTGSLPEAGYCLAQATRDAHGHEIVTVALGSENHFSRFQDVKVLTAWAFHAFEWK